MVFRLDNFSMSGLVQYVIVRSDLAKTWPLGALIAQACHACTAVMYLHKEDSHVLNYTADLDNMHKCILEVRSKCLFCVSTTTRKTFGRVVSRLCFSYLLPTGKERE